MIKKFDYAIIGSGLGGLAIGALLAKAGHKVLLLERHNVPGGYGHSFSRKCKDGTYNFCAHLHYVWDCGDGGHVHDFLAKVGLKEDIYFNRLDPDGFDHINLPSCTYRIANGKFNNIRRLEKIFPECSVSLRRYYNIIQKLYEDVLTIPIDISPISFIPKSWSYRTIWKYRNYTLQKLYDELKIPQTLQAILAGQSGCYFLPPEQVSLIAHAVVAAGYDAGAYYPELTYRHVVESISNVISAADDCELLLNTEVKKLEVAGKSVTAVITADGRRIEASHVISDVDPNLTIDMIGRDKFSPKYLKAASFSYSSSVLSVYLGLKNVDLSKHGIGNHNLWYYPTTDLNSIYKTQLQKAEVPENPFLFITAPTQHTHHRNLLAPDGHEQLVLLACCNYDYFRQLKDEDISAYKAAKEKAADRMIDVIEKHFLPSIRDHIVVKVVGTPTTNEHWVAAPKGNSYGAELTPKNVGFGRLPYKTPFNNLFLVGAAAGRPGFAGCITHAKLLYEKIKEYG